MTLLWVPLVVADVDRSVRFYHHRLGLPVVARWNRAGDIGAVLDAGGGRVEVVADGPVSPPTRFALQLPDRAAVSALVSGVAFPRGHFGGQLTDPDGNQVFLFTEEP